MRVLVLLPLSLLVVACLTTPSARQPNTFRDLPEPEKVQFQAPTAATIQRTTSLAPALPTSEVMWLIPELPSRLGALNNPSSGSLLLRESFPSRSWNLISTPRVASTAVPSTPVVVPAAKLVPPKPKSPATTPVVAPAAPKATSTPPPTVASTATLLPKDTGRTSDFLWQDVNAIAGDVVSLRFEKTSWLYLDAPSQQKLVGFQSITREKDATTFQFRPAIAGDYVLEFQRQDLAAQSSEVRKVHLEVRPVGSRTSTTSTGLNGVVTDQRPSDAIETSRKLAASGRTAEAVQKLLQNYRADDARVNLELAKILGDNGQSDEALSYLDKNLNLSGQDINESLSLGTKLATLRDPQKRLTSYLKLWTAGSVAPSEELYLQVFETLNAQKMFSQASEWLKRYSTWYPAPQWKDRYLYQVGQLLEEPGENRDVRGAWRAYTEVVENYPLSTLWRAAGERAAYLNRHFLQVR